MKHKFWLVFAVIQLIGIAALFVSSWLEEPTVLMLSAVMLLPGSMAAIGLITHFRFAANFPFWLLAAISVTANGLVSALLMFLLSRFRKPG
jgi:hypothetical protein